MGTCCSKEEKTPIGNRGIGPVNGRVVDHHESKPMPVGFKPSLTPPVNLPSPTQPAVKLFVAKYDYEARTDEDLSFKKGEVLEIIDDTCGDWWRARSRVPPHEEGYVPNNFVAEVKSLDAHE